ncbi:MAG: flagellar assembly protein FliW [Lachnospiraceae bacterium]|nr:flagellar assembly protein FliW [Lachnospiraceae bacterium]
MEVNTRIFGMIDIEEDKLIHFVNGIVGFPELTTFALIHDNEKKGGVQWLQSMQEPQFAIPVMNPLDILADYNPKVEDELLKPIGGLDPENMLVLVTVAVPSDLTKMTVNLRGPIVINANNRKACQVITEGEEYQVKFPIYDILKSRKAGE